ELRTIGERARYYVSSAQPKAFEKDGELLALELFRPTLEDTDEWTARASWLLPAGNPRRLSASDLAELELKHPLDPAHLRAGRTAVMFGHSKSSVAFVRVAIPFGQPGRDGYSQAIVALARVSRFQSLFAHSEELYSFMTTADGELA